MLSVNAGGYMRAVGEKMIKPAVQDAQVNARSVLDACPDVAGPKENNGCPAFKKETVKAVTEGAKNILFATGSSGRESAGATYYGVMEMGGNVYERTIVTSNASGVAFTGLLGDGTLLSSGEANVTNWPSVTTATGVGQRGGQWVSAATLVRTSDRSQITAVDAARTYVMGGRGVRE